MINLFGLEIGLITLLIIGFGFVWVIRVERYLGYLWWPYIMLGGFMVILISLIVPWMWISAILGAFGASLIWGSAEFRDQAVRAEIGWYPYNPRAKPSPPLAKLIRKWPAPHL